MIRRGKTRPRHCGEASRSSVGRRLATWRSNFAGRRGTPFARERRPRSWSTCRSTSSSPIPRRLTSAIPIVFVAIADPVAQGFVQSLARPGGIITGFGAEEPSMGAKWVQLLNELAPRLGSITVMFNPDSAPFARMFLPAMEVVRASSAFELIISPVRSENEIDRAIAATSGQQSGRLIALPDSFLNSRHEMIVALTAQHHVPAIYSVSELPRRAVDASGGAILFGGGSTAEGGPDRRRKGGSGSVPPLRSLSRSCPQGRES